MPDYNDIAITQTIPRNSPRPRRLDRSRERYPRDGSLEEVYVERRQFSRDNHSPKGHLTIRHDDMIRRPRHQSRSADAPRRQSAFRDDDEYSSEDSDSDYRRSRAVTRGKSPRHLKIAPCSSQSADHPHQARSRSNTASRRHSSSSSSSSSSESDDYKQRKHRNRKLLYTGLACVTTVAAANNIYQNTKAHHARRNQVREGEMSTAEVRRLKKKALLMDLATVGVVAVGVNNARMGWKRVEAIGKEEGR